MAGNDSLLTRYDAFFGTDFMPLIRHEQTQGAEERIAYAAEWNGSFFDRDGETGRQTEGGANRGGPRGRYGRRGRSGWERRLGPGQGRRFRHA